MALKAKNKKVKSSPKYKKYKETAESNFFFASEASATYEKSKTYSTFFKDDQNSVILLKGDCIDVLKDVKEPKVDMIFADPPYFLSNGGITCHAGKMVSVNKGKWDESKGIKENHKFNMDWLKACQRVLKPNGTIWVSGTDHVIHSIGYAMQELGFKILNNIVWFKPNAAPNLCCKYFAHSTEFVLWAAKDEKSKHQFDYKLMKELNNGKQMRNVWGFWEINTPPPPEKKFGKHPTQKPVELLKRIILASTKEGDLVLDPFCGSSTTGLAALLFKRKFVGIDLEEEYLELSKQRLIAELNKNGSRAEMGIYNAR